MDVFVFESVYPPRAIKKIRFISQKQHSVEIINRRRLYVERDSRSSRTYGFFPSPYILQ